MEIPESEVIEWTNEAVEQVSGGANPFADSPRVPEQPIDPELCDEG